jgi:hypothetical protein
MAKQRTAAHGQVQRARLALGLTRFDGHVC